ncbi:MAG: hypothetical protein HY537_06445 [Deltaproteobacteria bacterium]|nr:hypothetical protein [Deltaproteobacteria bacterium]
MNRALLGLGLGLAAVIGGIYLYKKYGGKQNKLLTSVAAVVLGDKVGEIAGFHLAGPAGAVAGAIAGAVGGAVLSDKFVAQDK